jgi:hypothetical protein
MDQIDIDQLFEETSVISTQDVVAGFAGYELTYVEALEWAAELDVARVGPSFAWTQPDVEDLADELDDAEDDDDGDDEEEAEDEDEEDDDD